MATIYPDSLDTDLELPRVDDNVTEVSGSAINSLRDAVFAIQRAVGLNPQGNKASLAERINVSIDEDGNIRTSALEDMGLLTLPIANRHVASNAAIDESKLRLDFKTSALRNLCDSLRTDMSAVQTSIVSASSSFVTHVTGQALFHDGYHIRIDNENDNGVAGLQATTIGDAINEFGTILLSGNNNIEPHIDLNLPFTVKHVSAGIAVDATNFEFIDRSVTTVQEAFDSLDASSGASGVNHVDSFHANGILKEINSGTSYNPSRPLFGPVVGAYYSEATDVITIPGLPASFADLDVAVGDILVISGAFADSGTYQIRAIGPLVSSDTLGNLPTLAADQLALFHIFYESRAAEDVVPVSVYKPASASSEGSPLACAVRNSSTLIDTISVMHPNAARAVSVGFNGAILAGDGYGIYVKVGIGDGQYRELEIPSLELERLGTNNANPVDAKSVAERINAYVSDPTMGHHFPITAFKIGNEIAIAHNWVGAEYTIELLDGYNGNYATGFDVYGANLAGKTIRGSEENEYSVNGKALSTIHTLFDGYASIESNSDTFVLWTNSGSMINPLRYGIGAGSVLHIAGHPNNNTNGSYTVLTATSTTVSIFNAEIIPVGNVPTTFSVWVSAADISLDELDGVETDNGLVEIYIDSNTKTRVHQRLLYGTSLGPAVEIIDISSSFPVGDASIVTALSGNYASFNIVSDSLSGSTVTIHKDFKGTFKLYHYNNIDYVIVKTKDGNLVSSSVTISVVSPLNYDEAFQLCTAHFNGGLSVTNVIDKRLFGNLSASQVRDDFIEVFGQRSTSDLRSNGVARGFDLMNIPYVDSITSMHAVPISGGVAYVNGARLTVESQKVVIQSFDEEGMMILNARRVIGINEFGSVQTFSDELGEILHDGYNSSAAFGKILPLYQVTILNGLIDSVTDVRLFINNLDEKFDITVDQSNNVVGNFRSLDGALLYAGSYPNREKLTVKILNTVTVSSELVVPEGISLLGTALFGGDSRHQIIVNNSIDGKLLTLSGSNRLENLEIIAENASFNNSLVFVNGPNVLVQNCLMRFGSTIGSYDGNIAIEVGTIATKNVSIINNFIDNVYTGIVSRYGCNNLLIENNSISNLSGTGGLSFGMHLATETSPVDNMVIRSNKITVPSMVTPSDIRGINIDIEGDIATVRVEDNSIVHAALNTMTNGIRIESVNSVGTISQLFVTGNLIDGIKLDENDVWGLYVDDASNSIISGNILKHIGVNGNTDGTVGVIKISDSAGFASITNNILENCNVTRGIVVTSEDRAVISGNTLRNLGEEAYLISFNGAFSDVSNNNLIGPSLKGVHVMATGHSSKISTNILSNPGSGTPDYAFSEHAIYANASDLDITGNTILGMVYDSDSVGISNVSIARERLKINNNSIMGNYVYSFIQLYGTAHNVVGNKLSNGYVSGSTGGTTFIKLLAVSNSVISNNVMLGTVGGEANATYGISSYDDVGDVNTAINNLVISGNAIFVDSLVSASIYLPEAEECTVVSNNFPSIPTGNVIGYTKDYLRTNIGDTNPNIAAFNTGLTDYISLTASAAYTAYNTSATDALRHPNWVLNDENNLWVVNSYNSGVLTRRLYFPITQLPNGSKLTSIDIIYDLQTGLSGLTAYASKKVMLDGNITPTTITAVETLSDGTDVQMHSLVVTEPDGEIITMAGQAYYVTIEHTGSVANVTDANNIAVYGVILNFRY